MNFIAFDIETHKITPDGANVREFRPLGISCAATLLQGVQHEPVTWCRDKSNPSPDPMNKEDLDLLIDYLLDGLNNGYVPLTWNGLGFDFDILAEESGQFENCKFLALNSVDMMFFFFCQKGYPVGLNAVAQGIGLQGKTEGMHGSLAPVMWQSSLEERKKVLEYVSQDVRTTLDVALKGLELHYFRWISKSGKVNYFGFQEFLTVEQCLLLPEPDTSWMSNPIQRSQFTKWMNE